MFVTLVALLCHGPVCVEEIITDSSMSEITWSSCQVEAQQGIAQWMSVSPLYRSYTLQKWKCVPGHYTIPGRA